MWVPSDAIPTGLVLVWKVRGSRDGKAQVRVAVPLLL
jgi:hypothetical protein